MSCAGPRLPKGVFATALVLWLAFVFVPRAALADSYSIDEVRTDARIDADGMLVVSEARRLSFDGSYDSVRWRIAKGENEGSECVLTIDAVGEMRDGAFVTFNESSAQESGTYQVSDHGTYKELVLFSPHANEDANFVVNYSLEGLVTRWEDTAELLWKFVAEDCEEASGNVTCTINLPMPEGVSIEDNERVCAWVHGSSDIQAGIVENNIVCTAPLVSTSEHAEVHLTFPQEWVADATQMEGKRFALVFDREQREADAASVRHAQSRMPAWTVYVAMAVVAIATVVVSAFRRVRYVRAHRPQFQEQYYRDAPSDDHPAVLGMLLREGTPSDAEFVASIMRLAEHDKVRLDVVSGQADDNPEQEAWRDYRILRIERPEGGVRGDVLAATSDRVDSETLRFLYGGVASQQPLDPSLMGPLGEPYVLCSHFPDLARKAPHLYDEECRTWEEALVGAVETRGFNKDASNLSRRGTVMLCVLDVAIGLMGTLLGVMFDATAWIVLLLLLLDVVAGVTCLAGDSKLRPSSAEAIELRAKLEALKRWLTCFSTLDEEVPKDVALWNRLLPLAVIMDVDEEVIVQLRKTMPSVLENPDFRTLDWYRTRSGLDAPVAVLASSIAQARAIAMEQSMS